MTIKAKKQYIKDQFNYNDEMRSIWQEVTEDGVFTLKDVDKFSKDEIENVYDDLQYKFESEFGYLFQ